MNRPIKDGLEFRHGAAAGRREARVEARMARREEARARDGSPDTANLPGGGDAMGLGGDDSFAAAQQRQV